jgi:hypothetical protein
MSKSIVCDAATTASLLAQTTDVNRIAALIAAMTTGTQTVSIKDATGVQRLTGTFPGTAYTTSASNFLPATALSSVTGTGGTPAAGWTCRVTSGSRWFEGRFTSGEIFTASAALDASGTTLLNIVLPGTAGVEAVPPGTVSSGNWLLETAAADIVVPTKFMGLHSDYISSPAVTYPVNPNVQASVGTVRSLDHDPDRGWTTRLCWTAIETSPGVYNWTYLDRWVSHNTGKKLIYLIDRTPAFYAKYTTSYNLYPSFANSSAPPTDWTKATDLIEEILTRHPTQDWVFELWNEPNFNWTGTGTTGDANRWNDSFAASNGAGFFIGTPEDLANGAKTIRTWLNANGYTSIPLLGPGWEGQGTDSSVNSFRRFSNAPCTGGGTGKDYVTHVAYHSYTYDGDGRKLIAETKAYQSLAATLGYSSDQRKLWLTEIGHENPTRAWALSDSASSDNVIRWAYIAASLGVQHILYYNIDSAAPSGGAADALFQKYYSVEDTALKIASNAAWRASYNTAAVVANKTITQAARLDDGRIWVAFSDGTTVVR